MREKAAKIIMVLGTMLLIITSAYITALNIHGFRIIEPIIMPLVLSAFMMVSIVKITKLKEKWE